MTTNPRRQEGHRSVGRCARRIPVLAHKGDARAYLRRHRRDAATLARKSQEERNEFFQQLFERTYDDRNLLCAWDYLARNGGQAPGIDGLRFQDLSRRETHELIRTVRKGIRRGRYRPKPNRQVKIPKASGNGTRTLSVACVVDRTVQRAITQIIEPFIDPTFGNYSLGFRPNRGREQALAMALNITREQDRTVWITEDIKNAFDQIPLERLMDIVRKRVRNKSLLKLIGRVVQKNATRGIEQGSPLSPLLLNLYLDHFLDRKWKEAFPNIPLLRYADDLLILCTDEKEATCCYRSLKQLLREAGLQLKGTQATCVTNMKGGHPVTWLGWELRWIDGVVLAHMGEKVWNKLTTRLEACHDKPDAAMRAQETILSWISSQGPAYGQEMVNQVYRRIVGMAHTLAFEELPCVEEVGRRWSEAGRRWLDRMEATTTHVPCSGGSACPRTQFADTGEASGLGDRPGPGGSSFSSNVTLYTDGSCLGQWTVGGWAYILRDDSGNLERRSGNSQRTTNNRMELMAVLRGLERLANPLTVHVVTDSQYVAQGITEWLPRWKDNGWKRGEPGRKKQIENEDLWRRLDAYLQRHEITCEWVRSHQGHPENEECDRLAQEAAQTLGQSQRMGA